MSNVLDINDAKTTVDATTNDKSKSIANTASNKVDRISVTHPVVPCKPDFPSGSVVAVRGAILMQKNTKTKRMRQRFLES